MYDRQSQPIEVERTAFIDFVEKDKVRDFIYVLYLLAFMQYKHALVFNEWMNEWINEWMNESIGV